MPGPVIGVKTTSSHVHSNRVKLASEPFNTYFMLPMLGVVSFFLSILFVTFNFNLILLKMFQSFSVSGGKY